MPKSIPDRVYQDLSISQRIRAAWEAKHRDDSSELQKLSASNEAGEYSISRVSAALNDLQVVSMAAEIDLLNCLVGHLGDFLRLEKTEDPEDETHLLRSLAAQSRLAASIVKALGELAEQIGLPSESILKSISPVHPICAAFIEEFGNQASDELTSDYLDGITKFLAKRHPQIACFRPAKQGQ